MRLKTQNYFTTTLLLPIATSDTFIVVADDPFPGLIAIDEYALVTVSETNAFGGTDWEVFKVLSTQYHSGTGGTQLNLAPRGLIGEGGNLRSFTTAAKVYTGITAGTLDMVQETKGIVWYTDADLKNTGSVLTAPIPDNYWFFPEEVGVVITEAAGVTSYTNLQFKAQIYSYVTSAYIDILTLAPVDGSVVGTKTKFDFITTPALSVPNAGIREPSTGKGIHFQVTTAPTGVTTNRGSFYMKGLIYDRWPIV